MGQRKSGYHTIEFQHNSRDVVARVYLGSTLSGGDDRDEIIALNVSGSVYLSKAEELMYGELALERAKGGF